MPCGARAAATSPPAFMNKPHPFSQLFPDLLLLNLTHTTRNASTWEARCGGKRDPKPEIREEQAGLRRGAERSVVATKRVMIVERRDLSSRATLEVQKRIAIGHRPSNLVNPRQLQMTFNGLSEGEAWLHRVQERCVPCPKAGREKVAHPV